MERRKAEIVILLGRMWVEKQVATCYGVDRQSSSLGGCELKNGIMCTYSRMHSVILLGRMWVEKTDISVEDGIVVSSSLGGCELKRHSERKEQQSIVSSSLGGCELKNKTHALGNLVDSHPPWEDVSWKWYHPWLLLLGQVILLGRMWVEKSEVACVSR